MDTCLYLIFFILSLQSTTINSLLPCTQCPTDCCPIGPFETLEDPDSTPCCEPCAGTWPFFSCCNQEENPADFIICRPLPVPSSCKFCIWDAFIEGKNIKQCRLNEPGRRCPSLDINIYELESICIPGIINKKKRFLDNMNKFLCLVYGHGASKEAMKALELIYDEMHYEWDSMLMFIAHALHNTCGFKYLTNRYDCEKIYKSRGLLMITEWTNYNICNQLDHTKKWTECPERMGDLSRDAICVTIKFWKKLIRRCAHTYCGTLKALNPEEIRPEAWRVKEWRLRLENRKELYRCLCEFFGCKVLMGSC